jgi:hypothetical protein
MEDFCRTQQEALEELEKVAPGAPFLALGQTVFWDEPMKAGVAQTARRLGLSRPFVSGVHDTDYFAKSPHREHKSGYAALPHNDTDTQSLWSAAGEFSALFGSETVVTRERLAACGGKVAEVAELRPGYLDEITEAWGWRGIVSYGPSSKTTAETPLRRLFATLYSTYDWAVQTSLDLIVGDQVEKSKEAADRLRALMCDNWDGGEAITLAEYYRRLATCVYTAIAGEDLGIEATRTTELLRFNRATCAQPRFGLLQAFLDPKTRAAACEAYDAAVEGTQMYALVKFGAGALPFDLFIPGVGRGTLRLGRRGGIVMTEEPVAFSFKKPVDSVQRLAEVLEDKFGSDVVLIGKAVTLVGMLASEYVFVMHHGASTYMPVAQEFHRRMKPHWPTMRLHPILRVRYEPWDALETCKAWLQLPEPLRRAFGAEQLSAESFAKRWRAVVEEQTVLLAEFGKLRRPLQLIEFLASHEGVQWDSLAAEYREVHRVMAGLDGRLGAVRKRRAKVVREHKRLRAERAQAEQRLGEHWRERVFQKSPTEADLRRRRDLQDALANVVAQAADCRAQWRALVEEQEALAKSPDVTKARLRRKNIAFEAELMRLKLVREAVIATDGLTRAGHRPSAWWFPLVSPSGCWYKATMKAARYYLEPLV